MSELLRVDGLSKSFSTGGPPWRRRRVVALDDVSLTVGHGRTLGLVGESGSGKSTLGRCILGLTRPDDGQVVFDGVDVLSLSSASLRSFRRRVQPVFQDPYGSLDPRWPVGRSVRESLDSFRIGTPASRSRRVFDLFDRVGLSVQAQILNLLADLQQDLGVASIFISHDLGVVEHVSDEVAVLFHGSIVETGETDQVMNRPTHDYTRTLLAAIPRPR